MGRQDPLNLTWKHFFGADISAFEERLIKTFADTLGVDDPVFLMVMMLVRILGEEVGATERAVLRYGPELGQRMIQLGLLVKALDQSLRELNRTQIDLKQSSDALLELQRKQVVALQTHGIPDIKPKPRKHLASLGKSVSNAAVAAAIGAIAALLTMSVVPASRSAATASWDPKPTHHYSGEVNSYTNDRK